MGREIERKFLVRGDGWKAGVTERHAIRQGYLAQSAEATVRVRIIDDAQAVITIKSNERGRERLEFEYAVPLADAETLLLLCNGRVLEKLRHIVPVDGFKWQVDVFEGRLAGLVLAEIELRGPDQDFTIPDWLGPEVTDDLRYYSSSLAVNGLPKNH
jgi:adenylate cyclase